MYCFYVELCIEYCVWDGTNFVEGHKVFPLVTSTLEHLFLIFLVMLNNVIVLFSSDLVVVSLFIRSYPCCCVVFQSLVVIIYHPLSTYLVT